MRTWAIALVCTAMLALAACGGSSNAGGAGTISLGSGKFNTTSVTIKAGQSVTFDDSNGSPHNLVTGSNGVFSQQAGAPSELSGLAFSGGDVKTVTFPTAGTYMITCTIHPSMEATITVTP